MAISFGDSYWISIRHIRFTRFFALPHFMSRMSLDRCVRCLKNARERATDQRRWLTKAEGATGEGIRYLHEQSKTLYYVWVILQLHLQAADSTRRRSLESRNHPARRA
jgi:hypothetical protein